MPEASAVAIAEAAPARFTVNPAPFVIVPEILRGLLTVAVKFTPFAAPPLMTTVRLTGEKLTPECDGVTV